jgi:hypothetical protein
MFIGKMDKIGEVFLGVSSHLYEFFLWYGYSEVEMA